MVCSREDEVGDAWGRLLALEVADDVDGWGDDEGGAERCCNPGCSSGAVHAGGVCGEEEEAVAQAPLMRCGRCGLARYCGKACQGSHWRAGHKVSCLSVAAREAAVRSELVARGHGVVAGGQGEGDQKVSLDGVDVAGALRLTRGRVKRARMVLTLALTGLDLQLSASLPGARGEGHALGPFLERWLGVLPGTGVADLERLVPEGAREARERQEAELRRGQREAEQRVRRLVEDELTPVHAYVQALCRRSAFFREYGDTQRLDVFFSRIDAQTETAFLEKVQGEENKIRLEQLESLVADPSTPAAWTEQEVREMAEEAAQSCMMGIRELRLAVPTYLAVVDECVRAAPPQLKFEFKSVGAASRRAWTAFVRINEGMGEDEDVDEALVNGLIASERSVRLERVRKLLDQGLSESEFDVDTWRERDIESLE